MQKIEPKLARSQRIGRRSWIRRLLREMAGQDLIEYALMAGFVAVAAGATMPSISDNITRIFSKVGSVMAAASDARGGSPTAPEDLPSSGN